MPSRPKATELFELDGDHKRRDADLHDPILATGDNEAALAVSRSVMRRLGFSNEKIDAVLGKKKLARSVPALRGWQISGGSLYGERYSDDQPRDELGRWTDEGGGDGGGDAGAEGGSHGGGATGSGRGSSPAVHERPSRPYEGASAGTPAGGRLLNGAEVTRTFTPGTEQRDYAEARGATPLTFHELGQHGGEVFHAAIAAAKAASSHGAAVTLYSVEDYGKMRTFLSEDGKAGFALKGDDIISVFRDPSSTAKKAVASVLALAVQEGGRRLDCFDTALPSIYSAEGFKAVSRTPFDDNYKPDGWEYASFKEYNGGKPDVVFMVRDTKAGPYVKGEGKSFPSYDEAAAHQVAVAGDHYHAGELFQQYNDPHASADAIVAKVRGAGIAISLAEHKLKGSVTTHSPVADGGFVQPDGTYTPEREALHEQILSGIFNDGAVKAATPAAGEKPTMTVLGGRGGSGKSWFTKSGVVDAVHAIYLNADDIQEHLPGYQGWNAALYHDEAADIAAQADDVARSLGVSVIHDATMRRPGGTAKRAADYKAAGYRVEGHYMFLPPQTSTQRALERFVRGGTAGRFVPPSYLLGSTTNEQTFDSLKGEFDKWSLYENMGTSPKLVAEGGK